MRRLFGALIAANAAAWLWAWTAFADRPALLGTAFLAWVFGLRHAFDADHIAAIDNVVRQMLWAERSPRFVGLWFSLGHSTVVMLACTAVAFGAASVAEGREFAGWIGPAVSVGFLLAIAAMNAGTARAIWRDMRRVEAGFASQPVVFGGPLARLFGPAFRLIQRAWHMFPLGFLFGLGFDTATEVGLLGIAANEATHGMSHWQMLIFPTLFAAGMTLADTADCLAMIGVYGWASRQPLRKLRYNLTITVASVAAALVVGGTELLGLLAEHFELRGGLWNVVAAINDDSAILGATIAGMFAVSWIGSMAVWRWKDAAERPAD